MAGIIIVFLYCAIAAFVAAHVFYHGVILGHTVKLFTVTDQAILTLASLAIGALWVLFIPGLTVVAARWLSVHLVEFPGLERFRRPEHARAGS